MSDKFIAISGGYDNLHIGHLRQIQDASHFGKVIVLLNSDEWLKRKKGYVFMPFAERKELLEGLYAVNLVLPAMDDDGTVCASIENLKGVINYFGKGGDRDHRNTPEMEICSKYEIPVIFGLGGGKIQSSSWLVKNVKER